MKLSFQRKSLKFLFWFGPLLILAGLTAGAVSASWGAVPLGLIIAGLVIIGVWLVMESRSPNTFWNQRSTQVGTNALISTLAVLLILGMLNFLAVRFSTRLDLTENRIFTLAPQSQEVVRTLKQPVKTWVFDVGQNMGDRELLENYRRQNNLFSYEFVDPQAKPGVAQQFGVRSVGEVYLETGSVKRLVQTLTPEQRLSERRLTNGLLQVTSTKQQKVYFVQGHGERTLEAGQEGMSQAIARLSEENFVIAPLTLAENPTIPDDAAAVVVAGPQRPLLEKGVTALSDYLKGRSGLVLMVDPQTDPKLDKLLQDWGVKLSDRLIVDPAGQASGLGAGVTIVNQYGDHPISKGFNGISFFPLARPIATTTISGVEMVPFLFSSERTQAQQVDTATGNLKPNPADPKPPYALGVALSRTITSEAKTDVKPEDTANATAPTAQSRLVVLGNSSFATDGLFEQQLNSDVLLNAISWVSQRDDEVLAIRPREMTNRRIALSLEQQVSVALLSMVLLPVIGFGGAALVWWRRR
ncbi:MAG: Gldg family protein [Oculatellaceae cyanobacterium Prado106]|jgi:ABC-type uncharacterized transport system involved in gliding motility auxiliary subunit|nr:Gldg family protein [Oculatellaceae cyanobacterium Prado106]